MPKVSKRSAARKARRSKRSSSVYRVRNWAAYDEALKQRGHVTVWFSPEAVQAWEYEGPTQRGAQFLYSDLAIETALTQIDEEIETLGGDGGYDKHKVFEALADPPQQGPIHPLIALRKDAKIQQHGNGKAPPLPRDQSCERSEKKGENNGNTKAVIIAARWPRPRWDAINRSSATN